MTVIKGTLSILNRQNNQMIEKQTLRIKQAVIDMEQLTNTFLLLARNDEQLATPFTVDEAYITLQMSDVEHLLRANNTQFNLQLQQPINMIAEPVLFNVLIKNLLINAINCTFEGRVSLFIDNSQLNVIDSGIGLDNKPRGYEGFGIGLIIVKDICEKYNWQFELNNNVTQGCTASVKFQAPGP
jgi:signal transduction histidine kinase